MAKKSLTTKAWAKSHGESIAPTPPPIKSHKEPCARTAHEIAVRTLILQGVVAVACEVDPAPIIQWFRDQRIWPNVTPEEKQFLLSRSPTEKQRNKFNWHCEAEWALLWVISKIKALGLPTQECGQISPFVPALGDDIGGFVASSKLRSPSIVLAEDLRTYNLWCFANIARRNEEPLPDDLNLGVLYERRYAFEWLQGDEEWDEVQCDS